MTNKAQALRDFIKASKERTPGTYCDPAFADAASRLDLAKMVEDMRVARESIIEARRLIDAVDNALADAFMYDAEARLKPYEKLFEKEGKR